MRRLLLVAGLLVLGAAAGYVVGAFILDDPATSTVPATPTITTDSAAATSTTADAAATALEAAFAANEAALLALKEANDEALRAELARIDKASEREADDATDQLLGFRRRVVAFWADFWAESSVPRDSLEGFQLGVWPETAMLHEIDFALSQVESNVERAVSNAEYAAETAAMDRLNKVTVPYYGCMLAETADSWATAEDIAGCGTLLEFDGSPEWPAHNWTCVRSNVEAVSSMRPDDDYTIGWNVEGQMGRLFGCLDLQLPDLDTPP